MRLFSIIAEPLSRAAQKQPTERASICPHNRLKRAGQYPELLLLVQFYTWSCQFELQPEQDSNICPSSDWCYPEERCSIRGLHSIESSSTLRHQSQGSMPLWPSQLETSFLTGCSNPCPHHTTPKDLPYPFSGKQLIPG